MTFKYVILIYILIFNQIEKNRSNFTREETSEMYHYEENKEVSFNILIWPNKTLFY